MSAISAICSWIVRHADRSVSDRLDAKDLDELYRRVDALADSFDAVARLPKSHATEDAIVNADLLIRLQARVGTLETWLSSQTGSFNLRYVQGYLENHLDTELKKLFEKTDVGKLSARQDELDKILANNADYHCKEMAELRWRISRVDLDRPVTPVERRIFVKLCLQLGEAAERMKIFADDPDSTRMPIPEEPKDL